MTRDEVRDVIKNTIRRHELEISFCNRDGMPQVATRKFIAVEFCYDKSIITCEASICRGGRLAEDELIQAVSEITNAAKLVEEINAMQIHYEEDERR